MIELLAVIVVVILTIFLNIGILIFVIPPLISFLDKLFRGEIAANIFEMFIVCFVLAIATFGFFALLASLI
jgi:hypothetical protein